MSTFGTGEFGSGTFGDPSAGAVHLAGTVGADLQARGALALAVRIAGTVSADVQARATAKLHVAIAGRVTHTVEPRGSIRFSKYLRSNVVADASILGRVRVTPDPLRGRIAADVGVHGALKPRIALRAQLRVPVRLRGDLRVPSFPHMFSRPVRVGIGVGGVLRVRTPPPNDLFASATPLAGGQGAVPGSNIFASVEAGEPPTDGASVWWRWPAPYSGSATVTTAGSDFDTVLDIFTGDAVTALALLASNDDAAGVTTSTVRFPIRRGSVYYLRVSGYRAQQGTISLGWVSESTDLESWSRDESQRFRVDVGLVGLLRLDVAPVPVPARFGGEAGVRVNRTWVVMPDPVIGPNGFPV